MAVNWLALITLALYTAAYMQLRNFNLLLERQYAKAWVAELLAFLCCGLFSLGNAVAFSVRTNGGGLCADFSGIIKSCKLANFVLFLSWLTVSFCIIGALARYMDWEGFEQAQAPSLEHYRVYAVEVQPRSSSKRCAPNGTPAPTSTTLTHKISYRVPPAPPSPTRVIEYHLRESTTRKTTPASSRHAAT
ncbi:hypothetical protein PM082_022276 [Marasmius tenuissimus]|nr:hypothetical protein PM082_022276 [Marasmius tenuissimus]